MFANFKKAFKRDESATKMPDAVLEAMSDNLPSGLKYKQIDSEYCKAMPEEGNVKFKFDNLKIKIPKEVQINTPEELAEFLYRTQQVVETSTNAVTINGKQIKVSDYIKKPYADEEIVEDDYKFTFKPESFGAPFLLKITYEDAGIEKEFLIKRQPLADMHKSQFKSINDGVLEVTYIIDEIKNNLNFNVHIDLSKAEHVTDIIEAFSIYIAFVEGKIKVAGMRLNSVPVEKEIVAATASLDYWIKVQAIADVLNIQFNPKEEIDEEDAEWIDKLYRSIVKNQPYKEFCDTARFVSKPEGDIDEKTLIENGEMALQYTESEVLTLYGVQIKLFSYYALINCKFESISKINKSENKYEFKIVATNEKGISKAAMHFSTEEKWAGFAKDQNEALQKLNEAEEL